MSEPVPPNEPIVVLRTASRELATYALEKREAVVAQLESRFGPARRAPRITLAYSEPEEQKAVLRSSIPSIVSILTGVRPEQVDELGEIRIVDAVSGEPAPLYGLTVRELEEELDRKRSGA